ncbi:MAG TPA: PIN domain nuclease [Treponema sp.]|jgi:predicted nucleic acid-binding protein|nr:PIN domain nuclease [Treponema sp.]
MHFGESMKVFLDTNILIDYLLKRHPFYDSAKKVFDMCLYKIDGYVTPHSLIDVFYMLSERTDATSDYCRETILKLRTVFCVVGENDASVLAAASNDSFSDFEDSMQNESALFSGSDYIITRNKKDFENSTIPVVTADEFMSLFST